MKKLLLLGIGLFCFAEAKAQTTIFSQDFNSSNTVSSYVSASSPTSSQFNAISASGGGVTISINAGKLRYARTANSGSFSRTADFNPSPKVVVYKFDMEVAGNSAATTNVAVLQIGSGFGTANSAETNGDVHSRIGINISATTGEFSLRDIGGGNNSSAFTGNQNVTWVVNNSGNSYTYTPPSGTGTETVANDSWDLFIGTTRVLNDVAATTPTQTLSDLKFAFTGGTATIDFDNINIQSIDVTPPLFTATYPKTSNIGLNSVDLSSNLDEIGTGYYVIFPSGATAPNTAQVVAGTDASDANVTLKGTINHPTANTDYTTDITGLTAATNYDVYLVAKDATNNFQTAPALLSFATNGTLPISLTSFTAKQVDKTILLNWATASEKENQKFEVLKSAEGNNFKAITKLDGAGNSDREKSYSFVDENPYAGANYYQLQQTDFNGTKTVSNVISANAKIEDIRLSAYASNSTVTININSPNQTDGEIALFDMNGRKLDSKILALNKGYNEVVFNKALTPGAYFINLKSAGKSTSLKFIK
ncbi:T9SS type A sorting domain-containing protein [Pedobacter arcticus]|uniref:T9SS type A sorting domain-containing protein n=1 Tax=Pedobacter arcticus TaxID=752140 RepID=UPI0002F9FFDF|nr:T9SS type A sorting domain-containing protein [Pedobacter arcticus]